MFPETKALALASDVDPLIRCPKGRGCVQPAPPSPALLEFLNHRHRDRFMLLGLQGGLWQSNM